MLAIVMALLFAPSVDAHPATPAQFDLICTGETHIIFPEGKRTLITRYRLDLDSKRYCRGTCSSVSTLARIEPNRLVLSEPPAEGAGSLEVIERTTWTYSIRYFGIALGGHERACALAPFSGLPKDQF